LLQTKNFAFGVETKGMSNDDWEDGGAAHQALFRDSGAGKKPEALHCAGGAGSKFFL